MNDYLPLPAAMVQRARDFDGEPAVARPAATVVLLRQASTGLQVYVLRRLAAMVFGGVYAFPGGSVDPDDGLPDPGPQWPQRLGLPAPAAAAVVGAAVREMFEETGVRLRGDQVAPWSRWITPDFEPRRFDTYFFVAALPEGQEPQDVSGEADRTLWVSPADALAGYADGSLRMLPPTVATLRDLAGHRRVEDVLAAAADRDVSRPITPRLEFTADGGARLDVSARPTPP